MTFASRNRTNAETPTRPKLVMSPTNGTESQASGAAGFGAPSLLVTLDGRDLVLDVLVPVVVVE